MAQHRFSVIDGLRGVAILAVLYHHGLSPLTPPGTGALDTPLGPLPVWSPLSNGWLGVNLFFMLSGFVLYLPYARDDRRMEGAGDVRSYYVRRARRLLPLFYISALTSFAFLTPIVHKSIVDVGLMLTALFPFGRDTFQPYYNPVLWSLGVEIWMSILFPLVVFSIRDRGWRTTLLGVLVISLAMRVLGNEWAAAWGSNDNINYIKDGFIGRLDDFVVGMWMAHAYLLLRQRPRTPLGTALAVLAGCVLLYAATFAWDLARLERLPTAIVPLLYNVVQAGCALVVLGLLLGPNRLLRALFANRVLQLLGVMCYSIYVWHDVLLLVLVGPHVTATAIVGYLVFLLGFAALSFRYIEFGHVRSARSVFATESPYQDP